MNGIRKLLLAILLVASLIGCLNVQCGLAQVDQNLEELYREMIPQFEGELKAKLEEALRNNQDFIELDSEQFRQFRDHPANPFDGWDQIDPDQVSGIIRLQFETAPVRSRRAGKWERQSPNQLQELKSVAQKVALSTVKVTNGKKQVCLGVIVADDGYVVTKASEVLQCDDLYCKTADGRKFKAALIDQDKTNDLALIKIEAEKLVPVSWASKQPSPGSFLVSPDPLGRTMAMGVYSHAPRSLMGKDQAYLGVQPENHPGRGLKMVEVTRGGAAEAAGMRTGDVLLKFDGQTMSSVSDLVNAVRARRPGDKIAIEYLRNGKTQEAIAVLAGRNLPSHRADRLKRMNRFGAIPSKRNSEFPSVLQHDTPLFPEQCGGPLCDLNGNVIGFNIARGGRVASYAIPAARMKSLIDQMVAPSVARRNVEPEGRK